MHCNPRVIPRYLCFKSRNTEGGRFITGTALLKIAIRILSLFFALITFWTWILSFYNFFFISALGLKVSKSINCYMRSMHQYCQGKNENRYICMLNNIRFSRLIDVNRKPSSNKRLLRSPPIGKGHILI